MFCVVILLLKVIAIYALNLLVLMWNVVGQTEVTTLVLVLLESGRSVLHIQDVGKPGVLAQWNVFLFSYQKQPPICFVFSYIGNVLVTVNEMQTQEFWQLSGCIFWGGIQSVCGKVLPLP